MRAERWFPLPDRPVSAAWSPDGRRVAVGTDARGVRVFDVDGGDPVICPRGPAGSLAWTADGLFGADRQRTARILGDRSRGKRVGGVIVGGPHGLLRVRPTDSGASVLEELDRKLVVGATWPVPATRAAAVARGEAFLATDEGLVVVGLFDGRTRTLLDGIPLIGVALSPDGDRVVVSGAQLGFEGPVDGPLERLPEARDPAHGGDWFSLGGTVHVPGWGPRARIGRVELAVASPDGRWLLVADSLAAWIVDPRSCRRLGTLGLRPFPSLGSTATREGTLGDVAEIAASRDWIVASEGSGTASVWRPDRTFVTRLILGDRGNACPIALDGDRVYVGQGGVQVWSLPSGAREATWFFDDLGLVRRVRVRGERLVVVGSERVLLLDLEGKVLGGAGPWPGRWGSIQLGDADLSDDGQLLVIAESDSQGPVRVCDPQTGEVLGEWDAADQVLALGSPHGAQRFALTSWEDPRIASWPDGEAIPIDRVGSMVRLGDGFAWAHERTAGLWGPDGPRWAARYHDDVLSIGISGDSLLTGGHAGRLAARDPATGALRAVFPSAVGEKITAVAFDPTGGWLYVGESRRLHVWELGPRPRRVALVDATPWRPANSVVDMGTLAGIEAFAFGEGVRVVGGRALSWARREDVGVVAPEVWEEPIVAFSGDGERMLVGGGWGRDLELQTWDGEVLASVPGVEDIERWEALSPDGERILVGRSDRRTTEAIVYDPGGSKLGVLSIDGGAHRLCFDEGGCVVGWIDEGPSFRWDPVEGTLRRWFQGVRRGLQGAAFGGGRALVWGHGGAWLLEGEGEVVGVLPGRDLPTAAALAPDGETVALADWHGTVELFRGGRRVAVLGHTSLGGWWCEADGQQDGHPGDAVVRKWEVDA